MINSNNDEVHSIGEKEGRLEDSFKFQKSPTKDMFLIEEPLDGLVLEKIMGPNIGIESFPSNIYLVTKELEEPDVETQPCMEENT
jgi:hypothetical protein